MKTHKSYQQNNTSEKYIDHKKEFSSEHNANFM